MQHENHFDFILYKVSDGTSETDVYYAILHFNLPEGEGGNSWLRLLEPVALADSVSVGEDEVKDLSLFGYDVYFSWPLDDTESISSSFVNTASNGHFLFCSGQTLITVGVVGEYLRHKKCSLLS